MNLARSETRTTRRFERTLRDVFAVLRKKYAPAGDDALLVPAVVRAWLLVDAFGLGEQPQAPKLTAALADRALAEGRVAPGDHARGTADLNRSAGTATGQRRLT